MAILSRRHARLAPLAAFFPLAGAFAAALPAANPLLEPSPLYFQYPVFDRIKESDFRDGLIQGMAQQIAEVDAIASNAQPASFENTIVALERSGQVLNRVYTTFSNLTAANTNPEHNAIDQEMAPKLAAHQDRIFLNATLFARVNELYQRRASLGLDPESLRLLERYHVLFLRAGAALDDAGKDRLRKIDEEMASANTDYDKVLLKLNSDATVFFDKVSDLDGFSASRISAAALAAKLRGQEGKWAVPIQRPTNQDALASLTNRSVRERIYRASSSRGMGGADDETQLIVKIAKLRARKATLLGYPDWARYVLEDVDAGTPAAVNEMLGQVAPAAIANAKREAADLQKTIDAESAALHRPSFKLEPWDWSYYSEKLRKQRFDFDEEAAKPYFELDRVLKDGLFYAAHELYGLSFKERKDLPVYEPDVRVFEVFDADGSTLALILFDFYARDNKQGGAWDNEYMTQNRLLGFKPVIANHLNIPKPEAGQPTLMNFDEIQILFHEFGHGLHGMLSNVQYPMFGGANNSPPDFVEFPSQFNEMWSYNPKVLAHMAHHYKSGEPIPAELLKKILAAHLFNEGFVTSEYVEASIIDQAWHQVPESGVPAPDDIARFETRTLRKAGMDFAPVPPRYHSTYFPHVFGASSGYSAQYYGYLWSDELAKDAESWMNSHGGLQRANGDFLRAKVLSRGFSEDLKQMFAEFYGRGPDIEPLLEARGLKIAIPAGK